eukprot:TRINITY_DN8571_c1_g1_i3.p1 TRINITY_DN8571_c1_g1~~TRINITY_DN8571_c1_g1_i3.p1  ORF type:complete len:168 (+),score=46.54 TRINITY_DN8571_c1_g1_i3:99-602(+)
MSKSGTCKFFNDAKGYGFIMQAEGGEDLFVHRTQLTDGQTLVEGDTVQYDQAWDDRKGKAIAQNVTGGSGGSGGGGFGGGFGGGGGGFGGGDFDSFGKGKGKGKKGGGACFTCGEFGHRASECPQGGGKSYGKGGGGKGYGGGGGQACRQWQQGNCSFGDRCRFTHD